MAIGKLRKKGMDFSLNSVILGVVFIIFMVFAAPIIYRLLASKSDVETCRESVGVKSLSITFGSFGTRLADPAQLNLDCHTGFLTAKTSGIYQGNVKVTDFSDKKFDGKTLEYKLKTGVADRMRDCWYMFGQGKTQPFGKLVGTYCAECYEIQFDKEVRDPSKGNVQTLPNFINFLAENNANDKDTYLKYLYGTDISSTDISNANEQLSNPSLDTSKSYAITYIKSSGRGSSEGAKAAIGSLTALGCGGGVLGWMTVGAAVGTVIPGAGTIAGGVLGAGIGCGVGLVTGIFAASDVSSIGTTMAVAVVLVEDLGSSCSKLY